MGKLEVIEMDGEFLCGGKRMGWRENRYPTAVVDYSAHFTGTGTGTISLQRSFTTTV
jgi:hypothetical protein